MRRISVIGIGAGDPEHVTVQAVRVMNEVDVFFVLEKGRAKDGLVRLRREVLQRYVDHPHRVVEATDPDRDRRPAAYEAEIADWHEARAEIYERLLLEELADGQHGAFLVWGDPALYDSTLRVLARVRERGRVDVEHDVVPGITSVQSLAARHRIPLNRIGGSVHVTTGRRLARGEAAGEDDVVVMLDSGNAFADLTGEEEADTEIYWGAYVGSADEILVSGRVQDVADEIVRTRAAARERIGWVMDTYLLRRRPGR